MGMRFQLRPLTTEQVARLATDAAWRQWVLGLTFATAEERDRLVQMLAGSPRAAQASGSMATWPVGAPPAELAPAIRLDKAWHAVHFLLADDAWEVRGGPEAGAVLGGTPVHACETGYGPLRVHAATGVAAIATVLQSLRPDVVNARFDPKALIAADIYPMNAAWSGDDRRWVVDGYAALRAAYLDAAERGLAVAVWIA